MPAALEAHTGFREASLKPLLTFCLQLASHSRVHQRHPPYYGFSPASRRHSEFALERPIECRLGK
jgi:hypothetical protein